MNKIAFICALLAGTLWGIMGLFTNVLSAEFGFAPLQITSLRLIVAAITFTIAALFTNRNAFKIKPRHIPLLFCMGVLGVMMTSFTYFMSMTHSSLAVAASLMYTAPAMVIVASRILFKDKITPHKFFALVFAFVGACFVSGIFGQDNKITTLGVVFGLLSGFFYGSYSIFGTYALSRYDTKTSTLWAFIFAALTSVVFADAPDMIHKLTVSHNVVKMLTIIITMGVLTGFVAYTLYTNALKRTEASKAIIVASVEPLVAALSGFLFLNQSMNICSIIGIILILTSVILNAK